MRDFITLVYRQLTKRSGAGDYVFDLVPDASPEIKDWNPGGKPRKQGSLGNLYHATVHDIDGTTLELREGVRRRIYSSKPLPGGAEYLLVEKPVLKATVAKSIPGHATAAPAAAASAAPAFDTAAHAMLIAAGRVDALATFLAATVPGMATASGKPNKSARDLAVAQIGKK
jgi:hypothetical protein